MLWAWINLGAVVVVGVFCALDERRRWRERPVPVRIADDPKDDTRD